MADDSEKWLIAICGPTATGKTALAISLARHFHTEIISVDSRQVYREIPVGTAQPDAGQLAAAPHHFIASHTIHQPLTAAGYAEEAESVLTKIYMRKNAAIAAGGSTLYYKALLEGLHHIPPVTEEARQKAADLYAGQGLAGLRQTVEAHDPVFYGTADIQNPRRLMRALEVFYSAGRPLSYFHSPAKNKKHPFNRVIKIGLSLPPEELYDRINARCDKMLEEGLPEEVKALRPYRELTPLQTVGYTEFFDYLEGIYTFDEAVLKFKQHTRNYAKRQMTWFRKDKEIKWFDPGDEESIRQHVETQMKSHRGR